MNKLRKQIAAPCIWWTSDSNTHDRVYLFGWQKKGEGVVLVPRDSTPGEWILKSFYKKNSSRKKNGTKKGAAFYRKGFVVPTDILINTRWKHTVSEVLTKVRKKVSEELKTQEFIPLTKVKAEWVGISTHELPFNDTVDGWLPKIRQFLYDTDLEARHGMWVIRHPIQDDEILAVIDAQIENERLPLNNLMEEFRQRGWKIPGKTTGSKKIRQFYSKKRKVRVRKDGTIESLSNE